MVFLPFERLQEESQPRKPICLFVFEGFLGSLQREVVGIFVFFNNALQRAIGYVAIACFLQQQTNEYPERGARFRLGMDE